MNLSADRKLFLSPRKAKKRKLSSTDCRAFVNNSSTSNELSKNHVNIIDRLVDVDKLKADKSLYALTREWLLASTSIQAGKNESNSMQQQKQSDDDDEGDGEEDLITKLPEPLSLSCEPTVKEMNEEIRISIRSTDANDLNLISSLNLSPSKRELETHELLRLHVNRWKATKKEWIKYYEATNLRSRASYDLLKSLYEEI